MFKVIKWVLSNKNKQMFKRKIIYQSKKNNVNKIKAKIKMEVISFKNHKPKKII